MWWKRASAIIPFAARDAINMKRRDKTCTKREESAEEGGEPSSVTREKQIKKSLIHTPQSMGERQPLGLCTGR